MGSRKKSDEGSKTRETRADLRSRAPEEGTGEVPLSDPQEFTFYPPREGRQWSAVEVGRTSQDVRERIVDFESDAGTKAWRIGDRLAELYMGFAERTSGEPTFTVFAMGAFDLTDDDVGDYLRIRARVDSVDTARKYGRTRMTLGFRIMDRLGLQTFEALAKHDLLLPDAETCRFPATVRELRAALRVLRTPEPPKRPSRALASEAARLNEGLAIAKQEDPDLATFHGRFVAGDGDILLRAGALSRPQRIALAKFILRFEGRE